MNNAVFGETQAGVRVGIDVGGTFTDVVCQGDDGTLRLIKIPTTRGDQSIAVRQAIAHMSEQWGVEAGRIHHFVHGTTTGTNAVLERKGAKIGLITTQGFKDVLEIGRQLRHRMYDMVLQPETPGFLVPGALRHEVPERISATGEVIVPLDESKVIDAVDSLVKQGVQAIAVCFLFSFMNASHERRVREIASARHPDLMVSLSSEVDPTFREYERTVVTSFDAYVKPVLDRYLENMEGHLATAGVPAPLQIMQSRGGLCSSGIARQRPVRLFLSGPAAGVIGARMIGNEVGEQDLITVDIGGTSCDISLISASKPVVRSEGVIDGYPVRVPMVDVNAIGAGGGSIAWLDGGNSLRVGPESAGSEPGPACYGRGGENATVTDASVVLGYIDPNNFAGGSLILDPELAYRAIHDKIAKPMGMSVQAAALGIHRVMNAQMAEGIRLTSIRRGFDPRKFSLMPLGGGGALHATSLAADLGIAKIIVPRNPGVLCAYGLLAAPIEHEMSTAFPYALEDVSPADMARALAGLDARLSELMRVEGVDPAAVMVQHSADVCYVGQSYNLEIPINGAIEDESGAERLYEDFLAAHDLIYGHSTRAPAKIVNLRSVHQAHSAGASPRNDGATAPGACMEKQRDILVKNAPQPVRARIIDRSAISPEMTISGPAIIEQMDTTILIEPGWSARPSVNNNLVLTRIK